VFDARHDIADGTLVVKTSPPGCPPNGTMGHCFIRDDFDLPRKLVEAHALGMHDELPREGCSECDAFS